MTKLKDSVSVKVPKFEVGGKEFELGRFTLFILASFEEEGYTVVDMINLMQSKPATWVPKVAYTLLTPETKEKAGSLDDFRRMLEISDLETISEAILIAMENADPKNKNNQKKS